MAQLPDITISAEEFGKVAVLMGGDSAEREISLLSGQAVLESLQKSGVDAHAVDSQHDVLQQLANGGFNRVFIALHGRGGEDGQIQGALETLGLPYTGSGVLGSALSMDKLRCKQLWQSAELPTPAWHVLERREDLVKAIETMRFPLMIKPAREGSSIGMSKVDFAEHLDEAWVVARQYDDSVIAEEYVIGAEYTVAILDSIALPVIRLETPNTFYDFEAKYNATDTQYHCPCGLSDEAENKMQKLALRAFAAVEAKGWGRVDLMCNEKGEPWLIEVNTVPGLTSHSLVPMAAKAVGVDFNELVIRLLATSIDTESVQ